MPRNIFFQSEINPYHVTDRCHNKEWFKLPLDLVWEILSTNLYFTKHAYDLRIFAFVMMANHIHLIVAAPRQNLSEAMGYFLRQSSRQINFESNHINQVWGGRFHRCEINSYHYFMNAYKYVYQNPVRAGILDRAEEYKYSSLHQLVGYDRLVIPCEDEILFNGELKANLDWINQKPKDEFVESMRKALKRKKFTLPRVNSRENPLETQLI